MHLVALYADPMGSLDDEPSKKGRRQWPADSLEGMPPKKRRLIVWWLLFSCLLYPIVAFPLRLLGVPLGLAIALAFLVFFIAAIPIIRPAWKERRTLHDLDHDDHQGHEYPDRPAPDH
jgi:hypothetical protein